MGLTWILNREYNFIIIIIFLLFYLIFILFYEFKWKYLETYRELGLHFIPCMRDLL